MKVLLAASSDPLAIPTFILAVLGFAGAVVALIWQFVTFRLSGAQVTLNVSFGAESEDGMRVSGIPISRASKYLETFQPDSEFKPVAFVNVRSTGRMPANVTFFWFMFSAGGAGQIIPLTGPELPCRLEPGDSVYWTVGPEGMAEIKQYSFWRKVLRKKGPHFAIELGDGRKVLAGRRKSGLT